MAERFILHCDLNNFFASVECAIRPELRGVPIAVCGSVEERHGICLAKNETAKKLGIRTGDTVSSVLRKCPNAVITPPRYGEYDRFSRAVTAIYARFTDQIEPFGCDESWLDVSASTRLFGDGKAIAEQIRETVKRETGLTVSVGVSFNKIFAKLGSDMKKPDAVTCISPETFRTVVWPLPVRELLGVGPSVMRTLEKRCIRTIGELANTPLASLRMWMGKGGETLWHYANGTDSTPVIAQAQAVPIQSVSHGMTPLRDIRTDAEMAAFILEMAQEVGERLRRYGMIASGVRVSVRDVFLRTSDYQTSLPQPTAHTDTIAREAIRLFRENYRWAQPVRSVSVGVFKLSDADTPTQLDLFKEAEKEKQADRLDGVLDTVRARYGAHSLTSASYLTLTDTEDAILDKSGKWNPAYSLGTRERGGKNTAAVSGSRVGGDFSSFV